MGVEAEFQACAKNLNDSIKREMARKGAMATNTLRNVELEVLSKGGSGKKYKRLPTDHPHRERHQHHSLVIYVKIGTMKP